MSESVTTSSPDGPNGPNEAEVWKSRFFDLRMATDLTEAARQAGAPHPHTVARVIRPQAKVVQDGDQFVTVLTMDGEDLPLADGMKQVKQEHFNLFPGDEKSERSSSQDSTQDDVQPDPQTGRLSPQQIARLTPEQYREIRAEHPSWLGLSR